MTSLVMLLTIGCSGGAGAVARFGVVEGIARRWGGLFSLATFLINITGPFAPGFILTMGAGHLRLPAASPVRSIIGTGFLGGYTTFSTLGFETHALLRRDYTPARLAERPRHTRGGYRGGHYRHPTRAAGVTGRRDEL